MVYTETNVELAAKPLPIGAKPQEWRIPLVVKHKKEDCREELAASHGDISDLPNSR